MNNNTTIVTAFLSAYEFGGVACEAVKAVRELHDLNPYPRKGELPDWLKKHYTVTLPKQVQEQTEAFDFSTIESGRISPIIAEIDTRLRGLAGDDRARYLFSLLTPFAELARIYHPTAEINRLQSAIENLEKERAMWESQQQDKPLFDVNGKQTATPKEQAEACGKMIERYKNYIKRQQYINRRFGDVLTHSERNTIEYYCGVWASAATQFANRLDALLLTYGIDLLQLQETSGIYLKYYRVITDVDFYIGSFELAQHYINALPSRRPASPLADSNQPPASQEPATGRELPSELDTEQARKYFARAVAAGLMSEQYKWLASQSLLACFCREMSVNLGLGKGYSSEGQKRLSWKPFEALFNVKAKNLTTSLNDIKKTGQDPIGIEKVEAIFKD